MNNSQSLAASQRATPGVEVRGSSPRSYADFLSGKRSIAGNGFFNVPGRR